MAKKTLIYYLAIAMFVIGIVPRVEAAFVPSQAIALPAADRAEDLGRIQTVLESKLVKQRLQDLGFAADEINARLSQMSDQQIHSFAQQLDDLRVGKDGLGVVIAVLLIIILVIVMINLTTGHRVVVTP
ncbi:MAG: hypothetical protein A4E64_02775 [Syntrophorhabdus sp. PtaU1.Bin058]|nr:MAG: hypothetical protein A4E64_02775 [Syntrophorhabdus sp. PtaU1.Bin058]